MEEFSQTELTEALRALESTIRKCQKIQPKLAPGTPQHTLLVRRIRALEISVVLIRARIEALAASQTE